MEDKTPGAMVKCKSSAAMSIVSLLPFLLLAVSTALDQSIIDYKQRHGFLARPKRAEDEVRRMFEHWLVKNRKSYNAIGEKEIRYQIFKDNLMFIDEHNSGNHSYELGLTRFADLTNTEYQQMYTGGFRLDDMVDAEEGSEATFNEANEVKVVPSSVDWRTKGVIGPVRNQGSCESCWAFSSSAAVEALHTIQTGQYIELSKQQLVDCDQTHDPNCGPGYPHEAMNWIKKNGGITTEKDYPYRGVQGYCDRGKLNNRAVSITGYSYKYYGRDEATLKTEVANQPVVAAVESKSRSFQLYTRGVLESACGTNVDHAILIIGYGNDNGKDYWLVKNSWGTNWGEQGYGRILRNVNKCGIGEYKAYPK